MAEIEIKHLFIRTEPVEGQENEKAELVLIGEDGKEYQLETRFMDPEGVWRLAPMDILEIDENGDTAEVGATDESNVPNLGTDDPGSEQPPANSFNGGETPAPPVA